MRLWPSALRVLRQNELPDVEIGPADNRQLPALGLIVAGPDEQVDAFEAEMVKELRKRRIDALPVEILAGGK